jgi:anti-sigma factor RsiW
MPAMDESSATDPTAVECRRIAELLADYLDGTLPTPTRELIEWHIEGCGPCVAFVNTYRGTVSAARKLRDVEIPPELRQRLLAVLRTQRPSASSQ